MRKILKWALSPPPFIVFTACLLLLSVLLKKTDGSEGEPSVTTGKTLKSYMDLPMEHTQTAHSSPASLRRMKREEESPKDEKDAIIHEKDAEINRLKGSLEESRRLGKESSRMVTKLYHELSRKTEMLKNELAKCKAKYFRDQRGNSQLHLAVKSQNEQAVQELIQLGADVNARNSEGETPIIISVVSQIDGNTSSSIAEYLMEHGATPVTEDMNLPPILFSAFKFSFFIRCPLQYKLSVNVVCLIYTAKPPRVPRNCEDIQAASPCNNRSGIYTIFPFESKIDVGVKVYCDLVTDGGGWTVFQRRRPSIIGTVDFERTWQEYADGFHGFSMADSHWLGLNIISELTKAGDNTLRIDMTDWNNTSRFAQYTSFQVANEAEKFKLTVGGFSGNAGDSLAYHNGMYFTTKDRDNDKRDGINCALEYGRGGRWYNACHYSNINGLYLENGINANQKNIIWRYWHGRSYSLKTTEMKLRSKNFKVPESCNEG